MADCIRCEDRPASLTQGEGELCSICVIGVKVDVAVGLRQLGDYLSAWLAFQRWDSEHPAT